MALKTQGSQNIHNQGEKMRPLFKIKLPHTNKQIKKNKAKQNTERNSKMLEELTTGIAPLNGICAANAQISASGVSKRYRIP